MSSYIRRCIFICQQSALPAGCCDNLDRCSSSADSVSGGYGSVVARCEARVNQSVTEPVGNVVSARQNGDENKWPRVPGPIEEKDWVLVLV